MTPYQVSLQLDRSGKFGCEDHRSLKQILSLDYMGQGYSTHENATHICSAVIIHKYYLVTAAHCVKEIPIIQFASIVAGTNDLQNVDDFNRYCIQPDPIIDKDFHEPTLMNDLAIMKVTREIIFGDTISKIAIPDMIAVPNVPLRVAG